MHRTTMDQESGESFPAPEQYVGYGVLDPSGRKIGKVDKIFVNGDGRPEYIRVRVGLLRRRTVLIPVGPVAADEKSRTLTLG